MTCERVDGGDAPTGRWQRRIEDVGRPYLDKADGRRYSSTNRQGRCPTSSLDETNSDELNSGNTSTSSMR